MAAARSAMVVGWDKGRIFFVVDRRGTLLYFNEAAEPVLGLSYPEVGGLPREKWASLFEPRGDDDELLPLDELPLAKAITEEM